MLTPNAMLRAAAGLIVSGAMLRAAAGQTVNGAMLIVEAKLISAAGVGIGLNRDSAGLNITLTELIMGGVGLIQPGAGLIFICVWLILTGLGLTTRTEVGSS